MTIKELEARSGMTRANIRFYEQEGLLTPQRLDNGYRSYSEEDLATLQRIRLLRLLGLSLEELRALQKGEQTLSAALTAQLAVLEQQAQDTQQRLALCRALQQDGADYASLDAQHWLETLEAQQSAPAEDAVEKVRAPIRRLFARLFDFLLYKVLWLLVLPLLLHRSLNGSSGTVWSLLADIAALGTMVLAEPLLLRLLGTTAGKWLLGLSVSAAGGGKLTYTDGLYRTCLALWYGAVCGLPVYMFFPLYRRYYECIEGKTLPWEEESDLSLKDEKPWRIAAYAIAVIALLFALTSGISASHAPPHTGELTVAEFAENFNHYADYHDVESGFRLDEQGHWTAQVTSSGETIQMSEKWQRDDFTYTETFDGKVQTVRFTQEWINDERFLPTFQNMMIVSAYAFAQAQDPTPLSDKELADIAVEIARRPFESFDFTAHGVRITFTLTHSGYLVAEASGIMAPDPNAEETYCKMDFTVAKISEPNA